MAHNRYFLPHLYPLWALRPQKTPNKTATPSQQTTKKSTEETVQQASQSTGAEKGGKYTTNRHEETRYQPIQTGQESIQGDQEGLYEDGNTG